MYKCLTFGRYKYLVDSLYFKSVSGILAPKDRSKIRHILASRSSSEIFGLKNH